MTKFSDHVLQGPSQWLLLLLFYSVVIQKQPTRPVLRKKSSENMQQIYWNRTSAWVFSLNLQHIFRTPFPKSTPRGLFLLLYSAVIHRATKVRWRELNLFWIVLNKPKCELYLSFGSLSQHESQCCKRANLKTGVSRKQNTPNLPNKRNKIK